MKYLALFLILLTGCEPCWGSYKADFVIAGSCYIVSLFLSVQSNNYQEDYLKNKREQRSYDIVTDQHIGMASMWESLSFDLRRKGLDAQADHVANDAVWERMAASDSTAMAMRFATLADKSDDKARAWNYASYGFLGAGTIFLIKGFFDLHKDHKKKKKIDIEINPYRRADIGAVIAMNF